jgi:hypothetical protein
MRSVTTLEFQDAYRKLPVEIRRDARTAYLLFRLDPFARILYFKEVYQKKSIWSARTALGYRVLGRRIEVNKIVWFWIGSHAEYDAWFRRFKRVPS